MHNAHESKSVLTSTCMSNTIKKSYEISEHWTYTHTNLHILSENDKNNIVVVCVCECVYLCGWIRNENEKEKMIAAWAQVRAN